jgi:rRNA small subunit pseudouridine methyltransferase Nep1
LNSLILEEASLELLPARFRFSSEAKSISERFGIPPSQQILDQNLHSRIVASLPDRGKRGRPDIVHLALLDATSTPLFLDGLLDVYMRTQQGFSIQVRPGTRPPRTLQRFCGVMAKLLAGKYGKEERALFNVEEKQSFEGLINSRKLERVISFTSQGLPYLLRDLISKETENRKRKAWVIGAFAHGHFDSNLIAFSDVVASISSRPLAAHVVSARLCYELELDSKN